MEQKKKQAEREIFLQKSLDFFIARKIKGKTHAQLLSEKLQREIEVEVLEDAAKLINDNYWLFIEKHIRPLIIQEGDKDTNIDLYKMLSATEFMIMTVKPLLLKVDGKRINYSLDDTFKMHEYLINAYLAFSCAIDLLKGWDGYKEIFAEGLIAEHILNYKEQIDHRQDSMTILSEHVKILAYSKNADQPILINATWWRLFCLCGLVLKNDATGSLVNLLKPNSKS